MNQSLATQFEGRKTLIVGLGATGLSVAQFLHRHNYDFEVIDDHKYPSGYKQLIDGMPNVKIHTDLSLHKHFDDVDNIIISPGVSPHIPTLQSASKKGKHIISDIEIFSYCIEVNQKLVAITGTNGKTTVTNLVTAMIERAGINVSAGGNLGRPSLDLLDQKVKVYVLELSSFQLENTFSLRPSVSVVLNISEDHLDRYESLTAYREAKLKIHNNSDNVIVNRAMQDTLAEYGSNAISFGLDVPTSDNDFGIIETDEGPAIACGDEVWVACDRLSLAGESGILNTQSAFAIGKALGLAREVMIETVCQFNALPHRLQKIGSHLGVEWVNDSKATNVGATQLALRSSTKPTILICGGVGKGADFGLLKDTLEKYATAVIVMGRDADQIISAVQGCVPIHRVDDMRQAVDKAQSMALEGYRILLSPACASFDMYANYIERGNDFIAQFERISR